MSASGAVGHIVLAWGPHDMLPFLASDELFELESDAQREADGLTAGDGLFRDNTRFLVAEVSIPAGAFDEPCPRGDSAPGGAA